MPIPENPETTGPTIARAFDSDSARFRQGPNRNRTHWIGEDGWEYDAIEIEIDDEPVVIIQRGGEEIARLPQPVDLLRLVANGRRPEYVEPGCVFSADLFDGLKVRAEWLAHRIRRPYDLDSVRFYQDPDETRIGDEREFDAICSVLDRYIDCTNPGTGEKIPYSATLRSKARLAEQVTS